MLLYKKKYMSTHGTLRRIAMKYSDMPINETMKRKIESLMELSSQKYKNNTLTYKDLQEDGDASSYLKRKYQKILRWINAIFERFDDNKIPQKIDWFVLDAYSKADYKEIRSMIEDDVQKLARLFTYIDYFFLEAKDQKYRNDYRMIYQLLKKSSSDLNWSFYERHDEIERLYNDIWENESKCMAEREIRAELMGKDISDSEFEELVDKRKQRRRLALDDYFTYERVIALLSDEFKEFTLSGVKDLDSKSNEQLQKLKTFFSNTIAWYRGLYTRTIDYNDELTDSEARLIELIFNLSEVYSGNEADLFKGEWEIIKLEEREKIISCIDEIYECGEDIINKYIGAVTEQDLQIRLKSIKYKLRNPLMYRILTKLEDIKIEIQEVQRLKDNVSDGTKFEESETLKRVEKNLDRAKKLITEKNSEILKILGETTIYFAEDYEL